MASLTVASHLFSTFPRTCQLSNSCQFFMLFCYLCILTPNARTILWANSSNFITITIFFQAMGLLATTSFTRFPRCSHFLIWRLIVIRIFLPFVLLIIFRSHPRILLLWSHLRRVRSFFLYLRALLLGK